LNESVARQYDALGRDAVMQLFPLVTPDEHTHTNMAGAELNARSGRRPEGAGHAAIVGLQWLARRFLRRRTTGPVVDASKVAGDKPRDPALPSLFLVGDSTVKSGGVNGAIGWGERIAPYFDTDKINVVNARHRRPQQPHLLYRRALGQGTGQFKAAISWRSSSATTTAAASAIRREESRLGARHRTGNGRRHPA
jgi:hypothetical protein